MRRAGDITYTNEQHQAWLARTKAIRMACAEAHGDAKRASGLREYIEAVTVSDVLLAIAAKGMRGSVASDGVISVTMEPYGTARGFWDLNHDSLRDQSDETAAFLYGILQESIR